MESIMVKGKPVYITDDYDFADILRNEISDDARDYFLEGLNAEEDIAYGLLAENPLKYCNGECDKLYSLQEYYENILSDIRDIAFSVYDQICNDTHRSRRTKNEQFALDKVMEIMKISAQDFHAKQKRKEMK